MKRVTLLRLSLRNFKGIREFTFEPNGRSCSVSGDNGTGKTTLADSFTWLLVDKDSQGKSVFDIKTKTGVDEPSHGLEHEVEGILDVDGTRVKLKKIYHEKWTKKHGTNNQTLTGNTTDHFIDDEPVNKSLYESRVKEIATEDQFKLLTSPTYFNTLMPWQTRRKIILDISGDLTDVEVIESDDRLRGLLDILNGRTIEAQKKVIKAQQDKINEELVKIPIRIDEVQRGIPDLTGINEEQETALILSIEAKLKEEHALIARLEAGGALAEKGNQLKVLESQMLDFRTKYRAKVQKEIDQIEAERRQVIDQKNEAVSKANIAVQEISYYQKVIARNNQEMEKLRAEWFEQDQKTCQCEDDKQCSSCGQVLPQELQESVFNIEKAKALEDINTKGLEFKEQVQLSQDMMEDVKVKLTKAETTISQLGKKIDALNEDLLPLRDKLESYQSMPAYLQMSHERNQIEEEISALRTGKAADLTAIRGRIEVLNKEKEGASNKLDLLKKPAKAQERIKELKDQERKLAAAFEKLQQELFMCEQFIKTKVSLLEEQINRNFSITRWKMFGEQINGGVPECCVALGQNQDGAWVPYDTALSNSQRINCGLDCLNTLAAHYGLSLPVFVDNAEAITRPIEVNSQIILLVVSEQDKVLRVGREQVQTVPVQESLFTVAN